MRVYPAIDLREGACVQLVGGDYAQERLRIADPLTAARRFTEAGFRHLHIVDLDAATGRGNNRDALERIAREPGLTLQVGGGVRTHEDISLRLALGYARVVVGTRAVSDLDWLTEAAKAHPGKLVLAADVKGGSVATHGWAESSGQKLETLLAAVAHLPLAAVLVTAVDVEGKLGGTDLPVMRTAVTASAVPVIASGGVSSIEDLEALAALGVHGAVIGMALYTGKLNLATLARSYAS